MPLKGNPVCIQCQKDESPMWTNAETLGALCLDCVTEAKNNLKTECDPEDAEEANAIVQDGKNECSNSKTSKRTSRRLYKTRLNPFALPKTQTPKGRGRRVIFKKSPMKAPTGVSTPITSDSVFYKGNYYQIGDIVSFMDIEGDIYYAQIRGFLTDQYCEKSAVITWLLPTTDSPPPDEAFDAATYIIGPEEELPRKLDAMEFVMHAPSDYYKAQDTPYPKVGIPPAPGFIWTSLETVKRFRNSDRIMPNV